MMDDNLDACEAIAFCGLVGTAVAVPENSNTPRDEVIFYTVTNHLYEVYQGINIHDRYNAFKN